MKSKATTVKEYLASLPEDRRAALAAVRKVILANLDEAYEECMAWGVIAYAVPHRMFPEGYHCDPEKPVLMAGLSSQKSTMVVYLMSVYADPASRAWFQKAWAKTGKRLDMGGSCIHFKRLEDVALDVIGEAIRRTPAKAYLEGYLRARGKSAKKPAKKVAKKAVKKVARKKARP